MPVSYPKGALPTSAPGMSPAVKAPSKSPVRTDDAQSTKGKGAYMKHHAAVGAALKAGNHKLAMHHTGHMMLAIRSAMNAATGPIPTSPAAGITDSGPDEGTDDGTPSQALPAKKPFSRGMFGAMKARLAGQ